MFLDTYVLWFAVRCLPRLKYHGRDFAIVIRSLDAYGWLLCLPLSRLLHTAVCRRKVNDESKTQNIWVSASRPKKYFET